VNLRRERRQSPRSEVEAEHAAAKAALLRIRIAEKQNQFVEGQGQRADRQDRWRRVDAFVRLGGAVLQRSDGAA